MGSRRPSQALEDERRACVHLLAGTLVEGTGSQKPSWWLPAPAVCGSITRRRRRRTTQHNQYHRPVLAHSISNISFRRCYRCENQAALYSLINILSHSCRIEIAASTKAWLNHGGCQYFSLRLTSRSCYSCVKGRKYWTSLFFLPLIAK